MKLPQRAVFVLLAVGTILIVLVSRFSSWDGQNGRRMIFPDFRLQLARTLRGFPEECRFAEKKPPLEGHINTYNLLADVGKQIDDRRVNPKQQQNGSLQVFLIPHTHLDPGWIWTVEEYYQKQVKNILDNLVIKMSEYKDMTFVWAEAIFLDIWWRETTEENRKMFKDLVKRGQVEIVNGGWVAPDEASTHYFAIIDLYIEGHQWVLKHLGVKPRTGWSPDPFGHSATFPYIFSRSGIKEMVIVRIHDAIKERLRTERNVELRWRQSWDLRSDRTETLCHIMPYLYNSFHYSCGPNSAVCATYDFKNKGQLITDQNVQKYAEQLAEQFHQKSQLFRHNVLIPYGRWRFSFRHTAGVG
jgi:alpha-mannosidase II